MKPFLIHSFVGLLSLSILGNLAHAEAKIGQPPPTFSLEGIDGNKYNLAQYSGKYVVLEWTNPDCPFVHKQYDSGNMQKLQKEFAAKGVIWLSICSSAPGKDGNYPPDQVKKILSERQAAPTAYLVDANGTVGKAYGAKTTPSMFVIDPKGNLIYSGAIDSNNSPDSSTIPTATNYVQQALEESLAGKSVSVASTKSYGCGVHY